jgi:hypothetical protein
MLFAFASTPRSAGPSGIDGAGRAAHEQGLCVMAKTMRSRGTMRVASMSIRVTFKDGVFEPLEDGMGAHPGHHYTVFSDEELDDIRGTLEQLKAAGKSDEFWNNPADAVYDTL